MQELTRQVPLSKPREDDINGPRAEECKSKIEREASGSEPGGKLGQNGSRSVGPSQPANPVLGPIWCPL
jgi:hypothetical protein